MRNQSGRIGAVRFALLAPVSLIVAAALAPALRAEGESTVTGRLTDNRGMALAGATILVYPAAPGGIPDASACAQVRTDPDGGFVAFVPPGRYLVAAVKQGYDVSLTEVHSLASRVLRMRVEPSRGGEMRRSRSGLDLDAILRGERDDILRSETPAIPPEILLAANGGGRTTGVDTPGDAHPAGPAAAAHPAGRDLFGAIDGQFVQSVGAGELPGFGGGPGSDADRSTRLDLDSPVNPRLAWDFAGAAVRAATATDETGAPMDGGVDHLLAGVVYQGAPGGSWSGAVHAGVGRSLAGSATGDDRLLIAEGVFRPGAGDPLEAAVRTWSATIDPGDGRYLTLDSSLAGAAFDASPSSGLSVYAGSTHQFGARTALRYGVEHLDRGVEGSSTVPRVGMRQAIDGAAAWSLEGEILFDPDHPGGRLALAASPGQGLRMTASVFVLPEYETAAATGGGAPVAAGWSGGEGVTAVDPVGAMRRSVDLSIARDFGPLAGHLAGGVGRTGARVTPAIDPGPLPLVSLGAERWYETRLGVAWKPTRTEMQFGYRHVAAADAGGDAVAGPDYRRLDLMVAQTLPSPRALLGAELRALLAWQEVSYDAWLAGTGGPASGLASRLTGGVGLTF